MSPMERPRPEDEARAERLAREIDHHRQIAGNAEFVWTWESPSGQRRASRRAELFVEHAAHGPGSTALELGCGTGVFLEKVARSGARLCGIDLSIDLLDKARERVAPLANVRLTRGDAERMPYPDGRFDAVYGSSILHHLSLERAMSEVFRVLRPGGVTVFTEPNILNPQVAVMFNLGMTKKYWGVSPDEMAFSRFRARRALRDIGFQDVTVRPFDFLHPSVPPGLIGAVSRLGLAVEATPILREIAGSLLIRGRKP
jgi:SAM-dependent methyltransferase